MKDDDDKEEKELKSIDDYVHPDGEKKISLLDFEKAKEKKEDGDNSPKLKTKFCFKYDDIIINFRAYNCDGDGVHIDFVAYRYHENLPIVGSGWGERDLEGEHVALTWWEKFLAWLGFDYTLEGKVEVVGLRLQQGIKDNLNKKHNSIAKKINDRFSL